VVCAWHGMGKYIQNYWKKTKIHSKLKTI
jgi:hypothetical protein